MRWGYHYLFAKASIILLARKRDGVDGRAEKVGRSARRRVDVVVVSLSFIVVMNLQNFSF